MVHRCLVFQVIFAGTVCFGSYVAYSQETPPKPKLVEDFGTDRDEEEGDSPEDEPAAVVDTQPMLTREEEQQIVRDIRDGVDHPAAAAKAIGRLPRVPGEGPLRAMRQLDRDIATRRVEPYLSLASQATLALARSGDEASLIYLHRVFDTHPERHNDVARAIATLAIERSRRPHDWPLLVRSLPVLDGDDLVLVLNALARYRDRAGAGNLRREVILAMARLGDRMEAADSLLRYWTGITPEARLDDPAARLKFWQDWFVANYPAFPSATPVADKAAGKHQTDDLLKRLAAIPAQGDPQRGRQAFEKGLCFKCHRYGNEGETYGPDLSKVSAKLQDKEIVESLLFPSQRIHEQYQSQNVALTDGRIVTGLVGDRKDDLVILNIKGEKLVIAKGDVEEITPSPLSSMPEALLDRLNDEELVDLFQYMRTPPE